MKVPTIKDYHVVATYSLCDIRVAQIRCPCAYNHPLYIPPSAHVQTSMSAQRTRTTASRTVSTLAGHSRAPADEGTPSTLTDARAAVSSARITSCVCMCVCVCVCGGGGGGSVDPC